jgi:hypothetical protein
MFSSLEQGKNSENKNKKTRSQLDRTHLYREDMVQFRQSHADDPFQCPTRAVLRSKILNSKNVTSNGCATYIED